MRSRIFVFVFLLCHVHVIMGQIQQPPGVVVSHLTQDKGKYIGSPSICILPNGDYIASHDEFGPGSSEFKSAQTRIFLSKNKGRNWEQIATIDGQFWSTLFVHKNNLYIIGPNKHHGNFVIRRSEDGGHTWTTPYHSKNGIIIPGEYHTAPVPVIVHKGRIWRAVEYASAPTTEWGKRYSAMVVSAPVNADLLDADNWRKSNFLMYNPSYLEGNFNAWLEGNAVVDRNGEIVDILRVDAPKSDGEFAAIVHIDKKGKKATFNPDTDFIRFPGGSKKFTIRYDKASDRYWTLVNYVKPNYKGGNPASIRNVQALCSSTDLREWTLHKIILEYPEVKVHGFQYVDWQFDGDDLIVLSRTAFDDEAGGAHNNHDANFLTFHRIEGFRNLVNERIP